MASKIAVIGCVNGEISAVFGKLGALHSKNAFSFAIVVGELFGKDGDSDEIPRLLSGETIIPLPTYFALGRTPLPNTVVEKLRANSGELCDNLYSLGRRTTVKTSEGIKIIALGGTFEGDLIADKSSLDEYSPQYSLEDVKVLRGANSADVLVTSDWPQDVRAGSKATFIEDEVPQSQQGVAELCSWLKPRYHFSTSGAFYEREPFFHAPDEGSEGYQITRFLSLAAYGNTAKQKWIYAFSLDPKSAPPVAIPAGTTASPLSFAGKKRKASANEPAAYSRYGSGNGDGQRHRGKRARPPPTPQECFFCLSNPNLATHLITSIGTSAYLTTAKGPLSTSKTFPVLGCPSHTLIIPLEHSPTLDLIQDAKSKKDTIAEMHRYRKALQTMVAEKSRSGPESQKLGAVTWEISRAGGIHIHWQFLPVPRDLVKRGLVEAAFKVEAENETYPAFQQGREGVEGDMSEGDFFKATIWAEDVKEKVLVLPLDSSFRFDLQFGRRVLAKLLGLEKRSHWQDCSQSEAEETADAETWKAAFKDYDFALDD